MFDIDKSINKMLGKKKSKRKDWDGDGVPNLKDCQPRNVMRQDMLIVHYEDGDQELINSPGASKSLLKRELEKIKGKKIKLLKWSWEG